MGFKVGGAYHLLKVASIKKEINNQTIEDEFKRKYEKELHKSNIYIEKLENELKQVNEGVN